MTAYARLEGTTTGRGPSRRLWNKCRVDEVLTDPNAGFFAAPFDDFISLADGRYSYTVTGMTGGTADLIDEDGGVLQLASPASDGEGITLRGGGQDELGVTAEAASLETILPAANTRIVMEGRFKIGTWGTAPTFFFGLAQKDDLATDGGLTSSDNCIGFDNYDGSAQDATDVFSLTADGTTLDHYTTTAAGTLSASDYVKLGFIVEGTSKVRFFVDGAEQTEVEASTVPTTELTPIISILSGGGASTVNVDWLYCVKILRKK